ncbi:hypothetical protein [Clostridium uliginosum]|uniref:Uncharacterized protein n=1 Tax=Clostridium uliginosum TaxID=119641 RepID=A0A1I1J0J4_9CLOT|nr:hypothetical protein [Clostridium uliginosum]SFC40158.1 hypothetical protein SAMN05421842_10388 [Clostridium uliginosum]
MLKLANFYIKVLIKTPLFFISLLFSIFIFIIQLSALKHSSILQYTNVTCFAMISLNLYFLISTSSVLAKKYELMDFLELDIFKKYLTIVLSGLIISIVVSLIPITLILVFKNANINSFFVLKGILNLFIILNLSNLISISIGASVGTLFKKWVSIVISVIVYAFFPFYLFNPLTESNVINKFLNIYGDSTVIPTNILCDEIFNISYFCDKLLILFITILLILSIKIIINKKKRILSVVSSFLIIICMIITISVGLNSVLYIHKYDFSKADNLKYHISSYKMDINIDNNFKNNVSFQLDINNPNDSIILELDDLFKIDEIKIDNNPVQFTHEKDKITLDYKSNQKENVNISISYKGYIHIEDSLGVDTFYCNNHAINLTDSFSWYPYVNNDNLPINYSMKINSSSNIYSNLDTQIKYNQYLLEGTTQKVNLFSGQYKDFLNDGIEYVIPSANDLDNFKMSLDDYILDYLNDPHNKLSQNEINELKYKKYKKVIVGVHVSNYSSIKLSDDVLLLEL